MPVLSLDGIELKERKFRRLVKALGCFPMCEARLIAGYLHEGLVRRNNQGCTLEKNFENVAISQVGLK